MTVHIVHAPADAAVAEALQTFLERRGQFVDRETGDMGFRPLMNADVVVFLWSKETPFTPFRLAMEKRALDAWADGRLVLVKLDPHFAPVGLRDLPFVDATFETQRELAAWPEIAKRVQEAARPPATLDSRSGDMTDAMRAPAPQAPPSVEAPAPARTRGGGALFWIVAVLAILAGAGAAAVVASVWLVNRIGATPGSLADTKAGVDAFAAQYGLPDGVGFYIALGLAGIALLFILYALLRRPLRAVAAKPRKREQAPHGGRGADGEAAVGGAAASVFVSYARADSAIVIPVCEAVRAQGPSLWLDKEGIGAGESWAGEIVRAIKTVRGVAVMCSKAAFESDHVKREIYLADRYKKHLLPVFIEEATPPEDFEYFFAGVQHLKLHETPEAERGPVMAKALAGV